MDTHVLPPVVYAPPSELQRNDVLAELTAPERQYSKSNFIRGLICVLSMPEIAGDLWLK